MGALKKIKKFKSYALYRHWIWEVKDFEDGKLITVKEK